MAIAAPSSNLDRFSARIVRRYPVPNLVRELSELHRASPDNPESFVRRLQQDSVLFGITEKLRSAWPYGSAEAVHKHPVPTEIPPGPSPRALCEIAGTLAGAFELQGSLAPVAKQLVWQHTIFLAVASREYCHIANFSSASDNVFLKALSRSLGVLALMRELGDDYVDFVRHLHRERGDWLTLEQADLSFDHEQLTGRLVEGWGLSLDPTSDEAAPVDMAVPRAISFGGSLCGLLLRGQADALFPLLDATERFSSRGGWDVLETLLEHIPEKAKSLAKVLGVTLPDDSALAAPIAEAKNRVESRNAKRNDGKTPFQNREVNESESHLAADEFRRRIADAIVACRQARCGISLIVAGIDDFATWANYQKPSEVQRISTLIFDSLGDFLGNGNLPWPIGQACWAIPLKGMDRQQAISHARPFLDQVRKEAKRMRDQGGSAFSVSAGIATLAVPSKNFPPQELIDAAGRCLKGAQLSGGDSLKSIDL